MPNRSLDDRLQDRVAAARAEREGPSGGMVLVVVIPLVLIVLMFGFLLMTGRIQLGTDRRVAGKSVRNVTAGMTYKEVVDAAGPPARTEPPDAMDTKPTAAVLFYNNEEGRPVRVFMTGREVSSVEGHAP